MPGADDSPQGSHRYFDPYPGPDAGVVDRAAWWWMNGPTLLIVLLAMLCIRVGRQLMGRS